MCLEIDRCLSWMEDSVMSLILFTVDSSCDFLLPQFLTLALRLNGVKWLFKFCSHYCYYLRLQSFAECRTSYRCAH